MIPQVLLDHAGLSKQVVVVGAGDRLELWSRERWVEHRPALLSGVERITADVDNAA
jgi:MraZ protein